MLKQQTYRLSWIDDMQMGPETGPANTRWIGLILTCIFDQGKLLS